MIQSAQFCEELYRLAEAHNGENVKIELNGVPIILIQRYEDADYVLRLHATNYRKNMAWFRQILGASRFSEDGEAWEIRRDLTQYHFTKFDREHAFMLSREYAEQALGKLVADSAAGRDVLDDTILREMTAGVLVHNFFNAPLEKLQIDLAAMTSLMEYGSEYSFVPEGRTNDLYRQRLSSLPPIRRRVMNSLKIFRSDEMPPSPLLDSLRDADRNLGIILEHELMSFLAAGTETSAATMTWICHLLAQNSEQQEKLREVSTEFWNSSDVSWSSLSKIKPLLNFVSEALRLYPTTPIVARMAVEPDKIGDFDIASNQNILLSFIGIQHDRRFRDNPWKVQETDTEVFTTGSGQNTAFSLGGRVCGGKSFAILELITFLSVFVSRGVFESTSDEAPRFFWKSQLLREGGQRVRVSYSHKCPA